MRNTFTIDVEEYYHAANLEPVAGPRLWRRLESRVEGSTDRLLDLLAEHDAKATFFILGSVADRHPDLIRRIHHAGHEIASHGHAHRLAYSQTPRQFARDVRRVKHRLEDLIGEQVYGYRAPNFSIQDQNTWAYDTLIEAGYTYDSSLFPVRHHRYANAHKSRSPFVIQRASGNLFIFPLATFRAHFGKWSLNLPIAGGAYWRLFPTFLFTKAIARVNQVEGLGCNCYTHPWEIDAGQPYYHALPWLQRIRHYGGASRLEHKLAKILSTFSFGSIRDTAGQFFHGRTQEIFPHAKPFHDR